MTTGPLSAKRKRLVPTALIMLSAIPVAAGASRVTQLTTGAQVTPDNARFFALPVPVILHIVGATVFCVLGAFQFAPGLRRRGWHRFAGRLVVPCGLIAALAGLWMTLYYPRPAEDGELYAAFRLVFGSTMVVALVLGYLAIRRRDFARHRASRARSGEGRDHHMTRHEIHGYELGNPGI
jgi:uncharacterized membrane protein YozB (DUF420 family)